jgi:hypothetical protein
MQHRAIRRGKIGEKLGMVDFKVGNDGGTGLGYTKGGGGFFYIFYIGKNGKFRPEAYVKNRLDPPRLEVAVQIKIKAGKIGSGRRSDNGDHLFFFVQGAEKRR